MSISLKEIVTGRKTFFITPDTSLLPEEFLEEYFSLGYECYFIQYDKKVDIRRKLEILISVFHDVIFFFNIDFQIPDLSWEDVIRQTISRYNNQSSIGVLYTKRQTKEEKTKLETRYLLDIGLGCGCIQLEYQKKHNFEIIEKILSANQAQGRRKNIRALCTKACNFSYEYNGETNTGFLQDISLSHFSFVYPPGKLKAKIYEKIADFHFNIRGFIFRSDAVLIMERPVGNEILYIFAFTSSVGSNGLDLRIKQLLVPHIYSLMSSSCQNLLDQIYSRIGREMDGLEEIYTEEE